MRPWRVTLRAKGIEQVLRTSYLGASVVTHHALKTGTIVENTYRLVTVDQQRRTALAIFERSRNQCMGRRRA